MCAQAIAILAVHPPHGHRPARLLGFYLFIVMCDAGLSTDATFASDEAPWEVVLSYGFFKLEDCNAVSLRPSFRAPLLRKGGLAKVLKKMFTEGGSESEASRLLYSWLDRRLRRVFGDSWPSHTRLLQVVCSLIYVGRHCSPRVLNALFRVLTDGVVLSCEGETYPHCLLNRQCGGRNCMSHYVRSLCWQMSLSRYNADSPFLHNLLRPPGLHTKHMGWKAFWLVKSLNWSRSFPGLVQDDVVAHVQSQARIPCSRSEVSFQRCIETYVLAASIKRYCKYPLLLIVDMSTFNESEVLTADLERLGVIIPCST